MNAYKLLKLSIALILMAASPISMAGRLLSQEDYHQALGPGEAMSAYEKGDYATAHKLWKKECDDKNYASCHLLGLMTYQGKGITRDLQQAIVLWEKSCHGKNQDGCYELGVAYEQDLKDYPRALKSYEDACKQRETKSCHNLGVMHMDGTGVAKDELKANEYFAESCMTGDADDCWQLGDYYRKNKSFEKSTIFFKVACEKGDAIGCLDFGNAYKDGHGVAQNYSEAMRLYERACRDGSDMACNNMGYLYATGKGVDKNFQKAQPLFEKACNAGVELGCENLRELRGILDRDAKNNIFP
jgi:TPR repeat protein